ncbi:MAG: radical SAM/SPASM domain-containing protein [Candidatus Micrarchaeia archaeon]
MLNYKLIEFQKKIGLPIVIGYPYWLTIDPSNICNLECVFCPTGQRRNSREKAVMKFEDFKKIIDKLGKYLLLIEFCNWGEPLLNPDLEKMILYTHKYNIKTKLSTNLHINLSEQRAVELLTCGIDEIIVSLDGVSQQTYEKYRRKGNFELVFNNLKFLVEVKRRLNLKKPHIHWQFLVFKHNEHEIEIAKKMAQDIGDITIGFTAPFCSIDWVSTIEEYNRYIVKDNEVTFKPVEKSCNWLWDGITINANGSVSPCCSVEDEKDDFCNFFNKPFFLVWNNKKYIISRLYVRNKKFLPSGIYEKFKDEIICLRCDHIGVSNHININFVI